MRKHSKKFIAIILSIVFSINVFPTSAFAQTVLSNNAQNALDFINSVGIVTGEIISVEENNDKIDFSVKYLPNNQISHLIYSECDTGITVIIDEGSTLNEIVFKNNGEVTVDGVLFPYFSNIPSTIDSGYYIYDYYDSPPAGWSDPTENESKINDVVGAVTWTVSLLSTVIASKVPVGPAKALSIASLLISTVGGPVADYFGFSIKCTKWSTTKFTQKLTKSHVIITVFDVERYNGTTYELRTLL